MSRTVRDRPWLEYEWAREQGSCWCCSPKRQRKFLTRDNAMKHSDRCRSFGGQDDER